MSNSSKKRVVVLGAGFGGLECTTILSKSFGDALEVTLIDKNDSFVFGFSKLDVMFGREQPAEVRHFYRNIVKPGVRFIQTIITSIDPVKKHVETEAGNFDADFLVVALGADVDPAATKGLAESGFEFYSVKGAEVLRDVLLKFERGSVVIGVTSTPFKCPPAPSEAALLLHDYFITHGRQQDTHIHLVMPFQTPIPPAPEASETMLTAFQERDIHFVPGRLTTSYDKDRNVVTLDDNSEIPCDLFLGIPLHHVPAVVKASGLAPDGWVPVNKKTLGTSFPGVYAVGDVASLGIPKVGVFAEGAARVVAEEIIAEIRGGSMPGPFTGAATCYIELGHEMVGRVDIDFLSGPKTVSAFQAASKELASEKITFGSSRIERWFEKADAGHSA